MKDRVISMAQFEHLESSAKWHANEPTRRKRRGNRDRKRQIEIAILLARARELGLEVLRDQWVKQPVMWRSHTVELNPELVLHVDHHGSYVYVALGRRDAFRGRFTPAEALVLVEALRRVRLPFRKPHQSRRRGAA